MMLFSNGCGLGSVDKPEEIDGLLELLYCELKSIASKRLAKESPGQTLQTTALVNEAYLKLKGTGEYRWKDDNHFLATASEAMRRILVDRARKKKAAKHGGELKRLPLLADEVVDPDSDVDILDLDEAVTKLAESYPKHAEIVKLRCFAGLKLREISEVLDIPKRTLDDHWAFARVWLLKEIGTQ